MTDQSEDDDILQDFLVEAGELLEKLNGQLVELEQRPQDRDLLNSVFRSFHTIKGGGGFLGLTALVEVCHRAEDVFNVLRQGERQIDAPLMDTILQVLDIVNVMFAQLASGEALSHAAPELLSALDGYKKPQAAVAAAAAPAPVAAAPAPAKTDAVTDPTDAEFEAMLDAAQTEVAAPAAAAETSGDMITDDEFEALLDQLQGGPKVPEVKNAEPPAPVADTEVAGEIITDSEFEALLDQLHGAAKSSAASTKPTVVAPQPASPHRLRRQHRQPPRHRHSLRLRRLCASTPSASTTS